MQILPENQGFFEIVFYHMVMGVVSSKSTMLNTMVMFIFDFEIGGDNFAWQYKNLSLTYQ
jgi:hypothetical protein